MPSLVDFLFVPPRDPSRGPKNRRCGEPGAENGKTSCCCKFFHALAAAMSAASDKKFAAVKDAVSCADAVNALFYCASPGHQMDRWYKDGALDGCRAQGRELQLCLRLKTAGPVQARAIVAQILEGSAAARTSLGVVWEPRDGRAAGGGAAEK